MVPLSLRMVSLTAYINWYGEFTAGPESEESPKHSHFDAAFFAAVAASKVPPRKCRYLRIGLHRFNKRPYGFSCSLDLSFPLYLLPFPSVGPFTAEDNIDNTVHDSLGVPALGTTDGNSQNLGG